MPNRPASGPSRTPVIAMIGMATVDYLYVVDDYPEADSVTRALDHHTAMGGAAGRGAIAAKRLGAEVKLLATCGSGAHAEVLKAGLAGEGVDCTWIAYDQPSQHSAVILARGNATRTILWLPQPMADARTTDYLSGFLEGVDVVLLDATDPHLATAALDECDRRGVTTVMDTGSGRPWTMSLLDRVDHVIAPESFVMRETGHSAERAAVELWQDCCHELFAVTQGPRGGVFTTGKGLEHVERWEAAPISGVDSCGAGDTFHGAYTWALANGLPPAERFATAAWAAGLKVAQLGNRGIPTLAELENGREASRLGKPL